MPEEPDQQSKLKNQTKRDKVKPVAYLSLAILFEVDFYFQILWFWLTCLFMLYKCKFLLLLEFLFRYSAGEWETEMGFFFFISAMQYLKIYTGSKGNKTEVSFTMFLNILPCLICLFGNAYFLIIQQYILVIEILINLFGVVLTFLELLIGFVAMCEFKRLERAQ